MKDWPSLVAQLLDPALGAIVAVVAIVVGWKTAGRTLRFNACSRVEDRIERELPKLRQVTDWLSEVTYPLRLAEKRHIAYFLENSGIGNPGTSIEAQVNAAIELADTVQKREITGVVSTLYRVAKRFAEIEQQFEQNSEFIRQRSVTQAEAEASIANDANRLGRPHAETTLNKARVELLSLYDDLEARRKSTEKRRDKLRAWIDRYVDEIK